MKLKKFTAMVLVAAASIGQAQAADYYAPSLITTAGYSFSSVSLPAGGLDFSDNFFFKLGSGSGSTVKFDVGYTAHPEYFELPVMTFKIGNQTQTVDFSNTAIGTGFITSTVLFSGLTQGPEYQLEVIGAGKIGGTNQDFGSYNLGDSYKVTVAAVPEPETYAMFLAGLGIMGAVARRRANKA